MQHLFMDQFSFRPTGSTTATIEAHAPGLTFPPSPPVSGLACVSALEVLGVSFLDRLDFTEHFRVMCAKAASKGAKSP